MTERTPIIAVNTVSKRFGPVTAVETADFTIERGEFFSLLGPSGCGKTTLLRMLAGFETPTTGEIYIDGRPMSAVPAYARPTNMVFQSYAIFPHLNVRQNIAFGLRKKSMNRAEIALKVDEALALIKMPDYGQRGAHELSGGQRQRVALARALVCQPKVLLLDEPLAALDKRLREEMQVELRQIQQTVGITFVMVTHDQEEALTLSDRIAVMDSGRILQIDSGEAIYEAPSCRKVAEFIGSMNFIPGVLESVTGGVARVTTDSLGHLSIRHDGPAPTTGSRVTIAVRPERITLSRTPPEGVNVIAGRLIARTYLGDRSQYLVEVKGLERPIIAADQNVKRGTTFAGLDEFWLHWEPEAARLLEE